MTTHQVLISRPSMVVGALETVLFAVWTGISARAEDVRACNAVTLQRARALKRCALVVAIHPSMPLPGEDVRSIIQEEARKLDPYLVCGVTVITSEGLVGTAMRALVSTLQLLSRPRHPEKVMASGALAVAYVHRELAREHPGAPTEAALAQAYDAITRDTWKIKD